MSTHELRTIIDQLDGSITLHGDHLHVSDPAKLRQKIGWLAEVSAVGPASQQGPARFTVRSAAQELGIFPSSIHNLYVARGRGEIPPTFTVPAMNLRALSYHAARAVFRAAKMLDAGAIIFELARSEMGYTHQRPSEYATNVMAAAIAEGYRGPVFIQGDHFQISAGRYAENPDSEVEAVKTLTAEAITAGFYNIDIDTSTLVDLDKPTVSEQQALNASLSAMLSEYVRKLEPPGVTVSIGGEIGEVGGQNSTEEELRAYMDGYLAEMPDSQPGLSKISIQTGTSHGGVVLPDGSIAEVSVDFDTLLRLSKLARTDYGLAGAVQHGASTLPEEAFGKFVDSEACEVHLATNFQTMMYERIPDDLRQEIYAYLNKNHSAERKDSWTDEQFYYKTQKRAIGPFKHKLWGMDEAVLGNITQAWEQKFLQLFKLLRVADTRKYVEQTVEPVRVDTPLTEYATGAVVEEDTSDLAD